jgi:hypothetical protein
MSRLQSLLGGGTEVATVRHGLCQIYVRQPPTEGRGARLSGSAATAKGWAVLVLDHTHARYQPGANPEVRQTGELSWPEVLEVLDREGVGTDFDWYPVARLPIRPDAGVPSMAH